MNTNDRIMLLINRLNALPEGRFFPIANFSDDAYQFTEAVKFCISVMGKPFEFSGDYKMVRRIRYV